MAGRIADAVLEGLQQREAYLKSQQELMEADQEGDRETEPPVSSDDFLVDEEEAEKFVDGEDELSEAILAGSREAPPGPFGDAPMDVEEELSEAIQAGNLEVPLGGQ
jgi:hypothetical protein